MLWGDHGFHLGDLGIWTKHTNYEQANRIPLLIVAPGVTSPGTATRQPAESVDVYPTLAELAGLPTPVGASATAAPGAANRLQSIDGRSLVPVLKDPAARVRDHAYHVYPKNKLGRAIRTERHRLVEWRNTDDAAASVEYELYDFQTDPWERENLAVSQPKTVTQLRNVLETYPPPVSTRNH